MKSQYKIFSLYENFKYKCYFILTSFKTENINDRYEIILQFIRR